MSSGLNVSLSANVLKVSFGPLWEQHLYNDFFDTVLLHFGKQHFSGNWAIIEDTENWSFRLPEQVQHCSKISEQLADTGLVHAGLIAHEFAVSRWLMRNIICERVEKQFFDCVTDCEQWLSSLGYDTQFELANAADIPSHPLIASEKAFI